MPIPNISATRRGDPYSTSLATSKPRKVTAMQTINAVGFCSLRQRSRIHPKEKPGRRGSDKGVATGPHRRGDRRIRHRSGITKGGQFIRIA